MQPGTPSPNMPWCWIQTFSGVQFWPAEPKVEDIRIEDIAHALSMQCRYMGHCRRFYSVAEHCVHVSDHCPPEYRLWGLLHDAAEAYLVDVARPLKPLLKGYAELEDGIMAKVIEKFGLERPVAHMPAAVKEVDNRILFDERNQLLSTPPAPWNFEMEPLGVHIQCWQPAWAQRAFLRTFYDLTMV